MFESIETDRLIICGFKKEEWKDVYVYASDPIVMEYIPEGVFSKNDAKEFIEKNIGEKAQKYAVILRNESRLIGHMVFHKWFGDHTYEIGWVFNKDYHNKGYATEAARALLRYGFEEIKLHRIIATCQPDNPPSYRVMEKIGMRREGYFKKCIKRDTVWWDEYFYAILEEEWKKGGQ